MARISIRELFRLRHTTYTHQFLIPAAKPNNLPSSSFSSSSSSPSSTSFYNEDRTLYLFQSCQNIKQLFQIQSHLITYGLFFNKPFWPIRVLKHSLDFGNIDYTILVFKFIDSPGTFCVNAVIKAYLHSSIPDQAVIFYFHMIKNGFVPNSYTFVPLLGSCAKMGCVRIGEMCHGLALKNGVNFVLPVQNCLIHMYGCFGVLDYARKVFEEMSLRDLVSMNSIVDGYVKCGHMSVAHELFDVMLERNVVSWNIMIGGYLRNGNPGCSLKVFRKMMRDGFRGNDSTMVSVITACGKSARLKEGKSVHGFVIRRASVKPNRILDTSLIDMYSKCQKVELARRVFDMMVDRNLVCWNAMILGHCVHGKPEDGLRLFTALVDQTGEDSPDEITFVGVLCACARAELLTEGRNYFAQMIHFYKIKPNFSHYWCLANLYAGVGLIEEAEQILRKMPEDDEDLSPESFVWANILSSCRFKGDVALGERVAKCLIAMEPNNFSYYRLLLNVYAVAGLWEDVARVKEVMKERKIERIPSSDLVDLKEIVHNVKVSHLLAEGNEEANTMIN